MPWTEKEVLDFQKNNNQTLAEINATLRPDQGLQGKVGIFLPGQNGDLITATSVLNYRDTVFPGKEIIWFANTPNADALCYAPISEVRPWPWAGNGLPEGSPDFYPLLCNTENRLNRELAKKYELTADLEDGYFPAPWMVSVENRHNIDYPNISRKVFKVAPDRPWHPWLCFSQEEQDAANKFITELGAGKRILIETFAGSGQSLLDEIMITRSMIRCNDLWGNCNFIFASHKFLKANETFPDNLFHQPRVFSCANFTVRQCALIAFGSSTVPLITLVFIILFQVLFRSMRNIGFGVGVGI